MIVVDASVATKWFLHENDSEKAVSYLEGHEKLVAPAIIYVEVHAAIARAFRRGVINAEDASAQCDGWSQFVHSEALQIISNEDCIKTAVNLSIRLKHPLADCLYIALAKQQNATLLTADKLLHDHALSLKVPSRLLSQMH